MDQIRIPVVIMRGGTSKGIYIKKNDLPVDPVKRDKAILAIFGSPDVRQIDGLAGADALTSKLAIVGPPTKEGADIDYTFAQVSITDAVVDYKGNCGNISSGIAPFAIDESMVTTTEGKTQVAIHNTNTGKLLYATVLVEDGKAKVEGDCEIAGVPGTAAPILMDWRDTAGAKSGKLLPTGNPTDIFKTSKGDIEVSLVDAGNPVVFVLAKDCGMKGTEGPKEIDGNKELCDLLEEIRGIACVKLGMAKDLEDATKNSPAFPMVAMVTEAQDYVDFTTGNTIKKEEVSFLSRLMFMQKLHKTYPGTGTVCTGACAKIPGTLVNRIIPGIENITEIKIGHPAGALPVVADVQNGQLKQAGFYRTARRIMEGYCYIPKSKLD